MGCISSKAIDVRSTSIREKSANHGVQWGQLLASASGRGDSLFSFVETKFRTTSFTHPEPDKWDPVLEFSKKFTPTVGESSFEKFTRSKSCQGPRREEDSEPGRTGSRSFHTVEEYDALLERIYRFGDANSLAKDQDDKPIGNNAGEDLPREKSGVDAGINLCCNGSGSDISDGNSGNVAQAGETVWKRRTAAKGLRSLDVSTVEFPAVTRFRQRWNRVEGHVYSPGSYITPKFGSYNAEATLPGKEKEHGDNGTLFSPELLAAFEDCMQQLQEDEDSILRDMDEIAQADDVIENQTEEIPTEHI